MARACRACAARVLSVSSRADDARMIRLPVYDEFIEALATRFELVNG